ncbi:hypothetical protein ONS95_008176 [Cadophora gregata]|uniref:uncharacterized protein n=1 Tax=Cadophora gregata TaxID=51156 RepID=UPI0026DCB3E0|nr:uncharacterized protein ONS95_008176 [Cadophora gregata]KAK0119334.1 hypothetical protein ONS96_012387 [Cadophora gregata f. sp. sojae]KAK0126588.1 hypothetical protein ONS95_008176 [Cadophora gregata]
MSSSAPSYLGESLGTEIVTINVGTGSNRKQFIIHKKLICSKVDFFHKAFVGGFKENQGLMDLPEEKPAVFGMFVDWLYRSDSQVGVYTSQEQYIGLFKLYFFAERFCIDHLQNRVMDRILITMAGVWENDYNGLWITIPFAAFIFDNTTKEAPLRAYCIHELAFRLWDPANKSTIPSSEDLSTICTHWSHKEDLMKGYFEFLRSSPLEVEPLWGYHWMNVPDYCRFHRHGKDEACYLVVEGDTFFGSLDENLQFED